LHAGGEPVDQDRLAGRGHPGQPLAQVAQAGDEGPVGLAEPERDQLAQQQVQAVADLALGRSRPCDQPAGRSAQKGWIQADGSWASELGRSQPKGKRVAVRVIDYRLDDPGRPSEPEGYRLITTILDPERAPAAELAALYPQRWELETALDELKTHQRGPGMVLRSKDPEGVCQEVWAHLLVHYAIRALMHQAALGGEQASSAGSQRGTYWATNASLSASGRTMCLPSAGSYDPRRQSLLRQFDA